MVWTSGASGPDGGRRLGVEPPLAGPVRISDRASSVSQDLGSERRRGMRAVVLHGRDDDGRPGRGIERGAAGAAGLARARPRSARLWVDGRVGSRRHSNGCRRRSCCVASGGGSRVSRGRGDVVRVVGIQGSVSADAGRQRDARRVVERGGSASRRIASIAISHGAGPGRVRAEGRTRRKAAAARDANEGRPGRYE